MLQSTDHSNIVESSFEAVLCGTISNNSEDQSYLTSVTITNDFLAYSFAHSANSRNSLGKHGLCCLLPTSYCFQDKSSVQMPRQTDSAFEISKEIHSDPITHLLLGNKKPQRIFCCSKSTLSVWDCEYADSTDWRLVPTGRVIFAQLGVVRHLAVHHSDSLVAVCAGNDAVILHVNSGKSVLLQGHIGRLTMCEFFDHTINAESEYWILTTSEDRTFKVWNVNTLQCLFSSPIVSSSPLTAIAFDSKKFIFCIGSEDGKLRFYNPASTGQCVCEPRLLCTIDIKPFWDRTLRERQTEERVSATEMTVVSSIPSWRKRTDQNRVSHEASDESQNTVENSLCVLNLSYGDAPTKDDVNSRLFVGCPNLLAIMDSSNYSFIYIIDFSSPFLSMELFSAEDERTAISCIPSATSFSFSRPQGISRCHLVAIHHDLIKSSTILRIHEYNACNSNRPSFNANSGTSDDVPLRDHVWNSIKANISGDKWAENVFLDCMSQLASFGIHDLSQVGSLFEASQVAAQNKLSIPTFLEMALKPLVSQTASSAALNFVYDGTIPFSDKSIFHSLKKPANRKPDKPTRLTPLKPSKHEVIDKPVTFRTKVKSSGYTTSPKVTKMFTSPVSSHGSASKSKVSGSGCKTKNALDVWNVPPYPIDCDAPLTSDFSIHAIPHTSSVMCIKYHPTGKLIASGGADKVARFYKTPIRPQSQSRDLLGNDGIVTDLSWRVQPMKTLGHLLLTTSLGGKVRLWCTERSEPLLVFNSIKRNDSKLSSYLSTNITQAQFYYKDKFIIIPNNNDMHVYDYTIERTDASIIKPQLNYNSYKLLKTLQNAAQKVTAVSCANCFSSQYVVSGTSDRSIHLWNMNQGQVVKTWKEAHTRPTHYLTVADYISPPAESAHLFASIAVQDGIKLWDIRVDDGRAVMHLHGHVNRQANLRCHISPCGRFVGTGSEDHHGYLYDTRTGLLVGKTQGTHGQVVSCVDFNPVVDELMTGCHDGKIRCFKS